MLLATARAAVGVATIGLTCDSGRAGSARVLRLLHARLLCFRENRKRRQPRVQTEYPARSGFQIKPWSLRCEQIRPAALY